MDRGRPANPLEYAPGGQPYQGSAIRQLRQAKKLGVRQFAALIPCNHAALSKIENNRAPVSRETLRRIAELLGVKVAELTPLPVHPRLTQLKAEVHEQSSTADQKLEALTADVQEVKAGLAAVNSTLNEILSFLRESVHTPIPHQDSKRKSDHSSVEDILRAMEPDVIQATVKPIEPWGETPGPTPDWDKAEKWDEECTKVEEDPGELMLLMKGLQGVTLDHSHYVERIKRIPESPERGRRQADFMRQALERRARRKAAFELHVKDHRFRHIMPIGALHWYKNTGFHRLDDWARHFDAPPATADQQIADIRSIINLLDNCPNYHLGLLTEENADINSFFNHFFWEVKGRQTLLLTDKEIVAQVGLTARERNYIIRDTEIVDKFCEDFDRLWTHTSVIIGKYGEDGVISRLNKHIELLEELKKSSVTS